MVISDQPGRGSAREEVRRGKSQKKVSIRKGNYTGGVSYSGTGSAGGEESSRNRWES